MIFRQNIFTNKLTLGIGYWGRPRLKEMKNKNFKKSDNIVY